MTDLAKGVEVEAGMQVAPVVGDLGRTPSAHRLDERLGVSAVNPPTGDCGHQPKGGPLAQLVIAVQTELDVIAFVGDISEPTVLEAILEALGGPADVLLSDAAPKLTGVRATDRAREESLLMAIEAALPRLLRPGGRLLIKILDGPEAQDIDRRLRTRFDRARTLKPEASRRGTTERYVVGHGYRGPAVG